MAPVGVPEVARQAARGAEPPVGQVVELAAAQVVELAAAQAVASAAVRAVAAES